MHTQVLVLGGGPGGYAAAFFAADMGMEVTIVDRVPQLGGTCLLRGCIPSKALLHVAKVINESIEMGDWGVKFESPKIDLEAMRARKQKIINTLSGGLGTLAKKRNVRIVNGNGYFEASDRLRIEGGDPATHPSAGCINFEQCIIATGSEPAMPKMFDIGSDRIMDSTGALELKDIPEKLLIVGAGYIGLEMGTVYASLGSQVKVVEMMDTFLPTTDADLARPLKKRLDKLFESIEMGTKVAGVQLKGDKVIATFEKGDDSTTETFDRVLVCIGRRPNSAGIGLENTKVIINEHGFINTDNQQRTDDPNIFAIGDVIGNPMLAHKASYEGKIAVEVIKGEDSTFDAMAIPAVVFTDPELAWAGITERQAKEQGLDVEITVYPWGASGRAQAIGRPDGLTKMIIEPGTDRVLGVGIVGSGAGELIGEATLAIEMGAVVHDMTECIHPHPTMSETLPHAGDAHHGVATEIYRPRRKAKK